MIDQQLDAQIEGLGENVSFEAEDCTGMIESTPGFMHMDTDMQWTSYPTPEAPQSSSQENVHFELPQHTASHDLQIPGYGLLSATCDPPMSFRHRHRFLNRAYNSYSDPSLITASALGDVAREVGLLMEEVLAWFNDEKTRRAELLARTQHQPQKSACQFPPSPESTRASGEVSPASSSYTVTSPGTPSQQLDIASPCPAPVEQKTLAPPTTKRGRPFKTQVKLEPDLASPDVKRKKVSLKYPCPDCGTFVAVERWLEHINRRHFPESVWECPKINPQTGKPCSASQHYRPSYRHDNFATHLKGEHDCADVEVAELKKTCKYEVTDFYHKVCGFCDISLASREESIEHIKGHLRSTSQQPNTPADFGVSLWKEKCGIEHKLQLGIHYRKPQIEETDSVSEHNNHDPNNDQSGGPSEGNSDIPGNYKYDFGSPNNSHEHGHDEEKHPSKGDNPGNSCHDSLDFLPNENSHDKDTGNDELELIIDNSSDIACGRQSTDDLPSSNRPAIAPKAKEGNQQGLPGILSFLSSLPSQDGNRSSEDPMKSPRFASRSASRKLTSKEDANFKCHVTGCGRSFSRSYNFKAHMDDHEATRQYPFLCLVSECDRIFLKKKDLKRHDKLFHKEPDTYSCDLCSRTFARKDELTKHMDDGCTKSAATKTPSGVSIADTTYHMLARHMHGSEDTEIDFPLYPDPQNMFSQSSPFSAPQKFSLDAYSYPRTQELYPSSTHFGSKIIYAEAPYYAIKTPEFRSPSNYSIASGPSASSASMGSPYSTHGHVAPAPEWAPQSLGLNPSIVSYDCFKSSTDNTFHSSGMDEFALDAFNPAKPNGFVDPSILHPQYASRTTLAAQQHSASSPYLNSSNPYPPPFRRSPVHCNSSIATSIGSEGNFSSEESKEKGRCTHPDCGKLFKDLKAHMLTHENERPEKCPIHKCDYHIKGFARKYDKNRHTLTHYKGTMVCGFCPGSGSAAEKSFNRADVFKRHLTSVHAVEQTPPNSRKKTSNTSPVKKLSGYAPDATGKCSTCSETFSNAQDFYEHLDDCVLRIVHQEDPSWSINSALLAAVDAAADQAVRDENRLPTTTSHQSKNENEDDHITTIYLEDKSDQGEDFDDENDDNFTIRSKSQKGRGNRSPADRNGVQKTRGLTHYKGGVTLNTKGREKRKDYPLSWGCPTSQMKRKKRVLSVFDGPRRLWKDDMMLDTDYEVMKLNDNDKKPYVTDLDIQTMRRANAFHNGTEEDKGPWISDDLSGMDLEKLMVVTRELSPPVKTQSPAGKAVKIEVGEKTYPSLFWKDLKSTETEKAATQNGCKIEVG